MGICCNQMKYGTVPMEKGTCQTFPAQYKGEMKEAEVLGQSLEGFAVQLGQNKALLPRGQSPAGISSRCRAHLPAVAWQLTAWRNSPSGAPLCLGAVLPPGRDGALLVGSVWERAGRLP